MNDGSNEDWRNALRGANSVGGSKINYNGGGKINYNGSVGKKMNTNVSTPTPSTPYVQVPQAPTNNVDAETDYYEKLKNQSYRALLDAQYQALASRDNAFKYTNNALARGGYGSQGIAESTNLGINNDYRNAMYRASEDYNNSLLGIEKEQRDENILNSNNEYESLATLISNANDKESLDAVLKSYGIVDNNGVLSGEALNNFDKNTLNKINALYNIKGIENRNNEDTTDVYQDYESLANAQIIGANGLTQNVGDRFNKEIQALYTRANGNSNLKDGGVIAITNNNNETIYVMRTNNGFKLVDGTTYNNAENKYSLVYSNKKEAKPEIARIDKYGNTDDKDGNKISTSNKKKEQIVYNGW